MHFAPEIARRFRLSHEEERILGQQVMVLDGRARRIYHRRLQPRLPVFARFLRDVLGERPGLARDWAAQVGAQIALR